MLQNDGNLMKKQQYFKNKNIFKNEGKQNRSFFFNP